jgi:hypothetical protein
LDYIQRLQSHTVDKNIEADIFRFQPLLRVLVLSHGEISQKSGIDAAVSYSSFSRVLARLGFQGCSRRTLQRMLLLQLSRTTPYGNLMVDVSLLLKDGTDYKWRCINPFALLYILCHDNVQIGKLWKKCLAGRENHISIYSDEFTPGDAFRPDANQVLKQQSVYFTFHEFPEWFRNRMLGWLPIGFMRCFSQRLAHLSISCSPFSHLPRM